MEELDQLEIKVYVKYKHRPLYTAVLSNVKQLNEFFDALEEPIVKFGPIAFLQSDLKYVQVIDKKK